MADCSRCVSTFAPTESQVSRLRPGGRGRVFGSPACLHAWRSAEQRARRARERPAPETAACAGCGTAFLPSRQQRTRRRADPDARIYCSPSCLGRSRPPATQQRNARRIMPCPRCGEHFTLSRQQEHFLRTGQTEQAFCSRDCFYAPWPRMPLHERRGAGPDAP